LQPPAWKITAAAIVESALARIAAIDGELGAFLEVDGAGARAAASASKCSRIAAPRRAHRLARALTLRLRADASWGPGRLA
jgi:Asp-tRNA(Asn)/Glu-tRNA(Gln) amidotransferase A subunit family amidase